MKAKIADFNLAKEATGGTLTGEYTHITKQEMAVYGSKAYLPRDFFANDAQFSTKSDVYSFGVVSLAVLKHVVRGTHFARNLPNTRASFSSLC